MSIGPVKVASDVVTTERVVLPRFVQHSGVVQAGVLATLADPTLGSAAHTVVAPR